MVCWACLSSIAAFPRTIHDVLGRAAYLLGVGLLVLLAIVLQFIKARELYGDSAPHEQRINCPSCGVRTPVESETCDYCDEPISR